MGGSNLQLDEIEALRSNFTVAEGDLEHLLRCWSHQNCGGCIDAVQCSWCPYVCLSLSVLSRVHLEFDGFYIIFEFAAKCLA